MDRKKRIERAISIAGRLTNAEVTLATERLEQLASDAAVGVAYFFSAKAWLRASSDERRAKGADFARRCARNEFPGLAKGVGSNANLFVKL